MPDIMKFYNAAYYITPRLRSELREFFEARMAEGPVGIGAELQDEMKEWEREASSLPDYDRSKTFQNYVWYILSTENAVTSKIPLRKYTESRRKRRNYFINTVKKEKKEGFKSGLLIDNCELYFMVNASNKDDLRQYKSKEDYLEHKYNQIIAWGSNRANDLVSFPFIGQVQAWRAAKCLFNDCACNIYSLIEEKYGGDVLNGYVKTLYNDINSPVWNINSKEADVEFEVLNDEINSVVNKQVTSSDGSTVKIKTTVNKYRGTGKGDEFKDYVDKGTERDLITSLLEKDVLSSKAQVLDSTDKVLCGDIYSSFSVEDINRGAKQFRLRSLVKGLYGSGTKLRREHYDNVVDRLDKMSHSIIDVVTTNAQGKFVKGHSIQFFEASYQIPQDDSTGEELFTSFDTSHKMLKEAIKGCTELEEIIVEISPSKYMKDRLRERMNFHVLTEIYTADMPARVKSMLMVLARERSDIYPQTSCTFPYDFFIHNLGFEPMKKSKLTAQIDNMLRYLKEHGYIVQDYKMTAYSVEITYTTINDEEKRFYNLDQQSLIGEA